MNQLIANKFNTLAVNLYKVIGSALLTLILVGLVSYLGVQTFFFVGHSWLAPTLVAPTDPQILQLNAQLAQQAAARDNLLVARKDLQTRVDQAERLIHSEQDFQERFRVALESESRAREERLGQLAALRQEYQKAAREISRSNRAYAVMARQRTEELYTLRMVELEERLTANHQLAQVAQNNLSLSQGSADLQTRQQGLQRELDSFNALLQGKSEGLTTEMLQLGREYTHSVLEVARAESERAGVKESLGALDEAVGRYDALLGSIRSSPWLEAIQRGLTVGFVPYDNLENARPGTPLFRCALTLVWCREVGRVGHPLQGEVSLKHPVRQTMLRGVMVELELNDDGWAREALLHLGRPPLWL